MSSRFPPLCQSAPSPALMVWGEAPGCDWELNDAARSWPPTLHWAGNDWAVLARSVAEQAALGSLAGCDAVLRLRWRAVEHDGGWLAWLQPFEDIADPQLDAMREQ